MKPMRYAVAFAIFAAILLVGCGDELSIGGSDVFACCDCLTTTKVCAVENHFVCVVALSGTEHQYVPFGCMVECSEKC